MGTYLSRSADREPHPIMVKEKNQWLERKQRIHDLAQTGMVVIPTTPWDERNAHPNSVSGYICSDGKCNFAEVLRDVRKSGFLARTKQLERCCQIVSDIEANPDVYDAAKLEGICIHNMGREIVSFRNYGVPTNGAVGFIEYSDTRRELALKAYADFRATATETKGTVTSESSQH